MPRFLRRFRHTALWTGVVMCIALGAALGLGREPPVETLEFPPEALDLTDTPILEWSWRVERTLEDVDETRTDGDDFAVRIYLVENRRFLSWRARALNYIWAHEKPRGSDWANPHASRVRMVAVRSDPPEVAGTWRTERRDVRQDFREIHGRDVSHLHAVAIMTDCDDTGQHLEGWYGSLRFLSPSRMSVLRVR